MYILQYSHIESLKGITVCGDSVRGSSSSSWKNRAALSGAKLPIVDQNLSTRVPGGGVKRAESDSSFGRVC